MGLPGITTVLQDKFSTISRASAAVGPSVVVIGYRDTPDGTNGVPDLEAFLFSKETDVIAAYGYGSGLHRGYLECVAGGATVVSLVGMPVATVDADLTDTTVGNVFDAAFDASMTAQPDIIVPWGRGGHPNEWTSPAATPDFPVSGSGIPKLGFVADNSADPALSLAVRVAKKIASITAESNPCFAVMGLTPVSWNNTALSALPTYAGGATGTLASETASNATLAEFVKLNNLVPAADASFEGTGPYLTIVGTECRPVTYPKDDPAGYVATTGSSFGYSNGAGLFAGFVGTLANFNSPTGQTPFNISNIRWIPTTSQQTALSDSSVVPLGINYGRKPVWVDAPTFGGNGSDYHRLSTLRIVFDAVQLIRQASGPFIGQSATLALRTGFDTAISSALRSMTIAGALVRSDYNIVYSAATNSAEVDLVLTPAFEIRNINISVSINLA